MVIDTVLISRAQISKYKADGYVIGRSSFPNRFLAVFFDR